MNEVARRIRDGTYDDETLRVTERLASAQLKQRDLQYRALKHAGEILTPHQRQKLADLIAEKRATISIAAW
jgi:Spy/CpxP family protein refolding chaperone